jgi:hypothetical protein
LRDLIYYTARCYQFTGTQSWSGTWADLVFYISILIFWFIILKLYARLRKLEQTITDIIRKDALNNAIKNTGIKTETKEPDEEQH